MKISTIAFDADDTLWHNEILYNQTETKFINLLSKYIPTDGIKDQLFQTELRNLPYFGYGIKSFTLSMLETASKVTNGCIEAKDLLEIINFSKEMLDSKIELLAGVEDTISRLFGHYDLMIITKGDLLDQNRKLAQSSLSEYFKLVEIVTDKTPQVYAELLSTHRIDPSRFLMVGNSLRSDILPVVTLGAHAVLIPYHLTWAHEHDISHLPSVQGYHEIEQISHLIELLATINKTIE